STCPTGADRMQEVDIPAEVAGETVQLTSRRVEGLDLALDIIVALAMFGELAVVIADVLGRTLFDAPLLWADEVAGVALTTMAFIGGALAYRRDQHIAVRVLVDMLPLRLR